MNKKLSILRRAVKPAVAALVFFWVIGAAAAQDAGIRRFEGRTLTFAGYSTTFNDEWAKSFGQYFEKRTGIKVVWIPSNPPIDIARIRAAGGKPDIDIMLMGNSNLARAVQEDVVGKVDLTKIPNMSKVPKGILIDSGIPSMMYRYGMCYRTDKFAELSLGVPNTAETWSAKGLRGHVMLPGTTASQWLISAAPIVKSFGWEYSDSSKFFDDVPSKIKAYGFFSSSGDVDAAMTSGDVWLTIGNNQGRCQALKEQGVPVAYANWHIKDGGKQYTDVVSVDYLVLAKGSANKELVELFMNEYLSDDAIAATLPLYEFIAGTPPTGAAVKQLLQADPNTREWVIDEPDQLFLPNYGEFLKYFRDWTTGWHRILG